MDTRLVSITALALASIVLNVCLLVALDDVRSSIPSVDSWEIEELRSGVDEVRDVADEARQDAANASMQADMAKFQAEQAEESVEELKSTICTETRFQLCP